MSNALLFICTYCPFALFALLLVLWAYWFTVVLRSYSIPQQGCVRVIEQTGHVTATDSHKALKFLTKPFVLKTSKKLITTPYEKVALSLFFSSLVVVINSIFDVARTACNPF